MMPIDNPFARLAISLDVTRLYGYRAQLRAIFEQVSSTPPGSMELLGLPGMGKTTLLRAVAASEQVLQDQELREWLQPPFDSNPALLFPVMVEFRLLPSARHPFVYLYRRFHDEYSTYRKRHLGGSNPTLARLPELAERAPANPEGATAILEDEIQQLKELNIRPVLLLDDFDLALKSMTFDDTIRMRPWRDAVAFLMTTERPFHLVNAQAAGSPFFQTIPLERIGGFTPQEARTFLTRTAHDAGVSLPPSDVEFVMEQAGGHVFLLSLAGKALWELRAQLKLPTDEPLGRHAAALRALLADEFRRAFHLYLERLEPQEMEAVRDLVANGGMEVADARRVALASLQGKGIVQYEPATAQYVFFSPLFADFAAEMIEAAAAASIPGPNELSSLEQNLYEYLQAHPNRLCTFEELTTEVWHTDDSEQTRRRMQVATSRLRSKLLGSTHEDIVSVRGQGYRFVPRS